MESFREKAENFIRNETQFQLGFLPSEAANPRTAHLDRDFAESSAHGLASLFSCDAALPPVLTEALASPEFAELAARVKESFAAGGRVILSGCGATGRISILIEAMWRDLHPGDDRVVAMMTGGELALARAVEHFEDYPEGGARQCADLGVDRRDLLIGITATGETASIVGSAAEAARRGAAVTMLICVPKELPPSRLDRCRELYAMPRVTVLAMPGCGGMAISGSTRMQSSTLEMLVVCAALDAADGRDAADYPEKLRRLTASLLRPENLAALGGYLDCEAAVSGAHELIDYVPGFWLLDVLNDTTERPPTFKVPAFANRGDTAAPQPWCFVRDLERSTPEAWRHCFRRDPRCITWGAADYAAMGAARRLAEKGVPELSAAELFRIPIGAEELPERAAAHRVGISLSPEGVFAFSTEKGGFAAKLDVAPTELRTFDHLAVKLVMNAVSSGVMVKLGRIRGNWMTHLNLSNKKLVDRAVRIIAGLAGLDYHTACIELFRSLEELRDKPEVPAVNYTLERLGR